MDFILNSKNDGLSAQVEAPQQFVNPLGEPPRAQSVSPGNAAAAAFIAAGSDSPDVLGLAGNGGGKDVKNFLFMALVGYVLWKYGKGLIHV